MTARRWSSASWRWRCASSAGAGRRVGRNDRAVYVEPFSLTREETAALIGRLARSSVAWLEDPPW